jgi:pimeloyl-ACP methyl ester carboxylesterase
MTVRKNLLLTSGTTISYLDNERTIKPAIIFIHGNSQSAKIWVEQLNCQVLEENFRLVAIDLHYHGESSEMGLVNESLSIQKLGEAVKEFIILLELKCFIIGGFSLGTNILCETLPIENCTGLFLVGSSVIGKGYEVEDVFIQQKDTSVLFGDVPNIEAFEALLVSVLQKETYKKHSKSVLNDYLNVKPPFRSSLLQSVMSKTYSDGIVALENFGKPIFTVFGANETLVKADYLNSAPFEKWRDTVFLLPGADHFAQLDAAEAFNQLLFEYCNEIFYSHPSVDA